MVPNDANLLAELQARVNEGHKIEAIKRYREATGVGLAEAKAAVESLERGESSSTKQTEDFSFETEVVSLLQGGKKINAIKLYRERTGVGLKEAKDAVEAIATAQHIIAPSGSGCFGIVVLLVVSVAAIVLAGAPSRKADSLARSSKEPTLVDDLAVIKSKQFVDLTHAFEPGIPHWPGFLHKFHLEISEDEDTIQKPRE